MSTCVDSGHFDKGPIGMLTKSLQAAQKVNRRCPSRRQHPGRDTAVLCKAIHAGTYARIKTRRLHTRWVDELFDEARREAMKYFEAMGVLEDDPCASSGSTSRRPMDVTGAGGQGVQQRNESSNVGGDTSVRSTEAVDTTARTKRYKDCAQ